MKKSNNITAFTEKEARSGNKLIAEFMGAVLHVNGSTGEWFKFDGGVSYDVPDLKYHSSWDWLMPVRYKIIVIGAHLKIDGHSKLIWWYSPKKTGTFRGGAGGCGDWKEKRDPFDAIFGKYHKRYVGVGNSAEKINRETEILATWDNIVYFIKWLKKTCPKLKNHIYERKKN